MSQPESAPPPATVDVEPLQVLEQPLSTEPIAPPTPPPVDCTPELAAIVTEAPQESTPAPSEPETSELTAESNMAPKKAVKTVREEVVVVEESVEELVEVVAPTSPKNKKGAVKSPANKKNFLADMAAAKKGAMAQGVQAGGALDLHSYIKDPDWRAELAPLFHKPYMPKIQATLADELAKGVQVFPPLPLVFSAFNECPLANVKVVLIGQDPYHDDNQAHGMCFSVMPGIKPPPSLVNMYKELATDIPGFVAPNHGYLGAWAKQGLLMLNASLTVEAHKANSHSKIGWQEFTDDVITILSKQHTGLVFLLWGGFAQKKGKKIDRAKHTVIEVAHPSPLSVTKWVGCKTFSKCNAALTALGKQPIDWRLPATVEPFNL